MLNQTRYRDLVVHTVTEPMLSFLEECDDDYTAEQVTACENLLYAYLESLAAMEYPTDEAIMEQVKTLILALNALNEQADYAMIETGEREAICEIIQCSAVECGLHNPCEDITEEWRDW